MKLRAFGVVLVCTLMLVGCGNNGTEIDKNDNDISNAEEIIKEIKYADDEIVNQFIIDFTNIAGYGFTDINKGNIKTEYYCYAKDIYVELINATKNAAGTFSISYGFSTQIPTYRDLTNEETFNFLTECLKTLGASDDEISRTIEDLTINNEGDYMKEDYEVNNSITLLYCPTKDLSSGKSIGQIEITSSAYGK